tara:strand:- start:177 stop:905 length:729 start_codon:yes stop_codon:yes gene_type:complete
MQQFVTSILFCLHHAKYLFILFLPAITLDFVQLYILMNFISSSISLEMSEIAMLEALSSIPPPFNQIQLLSSIIFVILTGSLSVAFRSIAGGELKTPHQALFSGAGKFISLLGAWLIFYLMIMGSLFLSLAILGSLGIIIWGFIFSYAIARFGMIPSFIMFKKANAIDALKLSFETTQDHASKLFILTIAFFLMQIVLTSIFFLIIGSNSLFLILALFVKYLTLASLFYVFFSLYEFKYINI